LAQAMKQASPLLSQGAHLPSTHHSWPAAHSASLAHVSVGAGAHWPQQASTQPVPGAASGQQDLHSARLHTWSAAQSESAMQAT
jgi:hypothetical protein